MDFEECGVERFTTAELLRKREMPEGKSAD